MGHYISTEVEAEDIIQAMCDDGDFMLAIFDEIAAGLNRGMLLDNAIDAVPDWQNYNGFKAQMLEMFAMIEDRYLDHNA